MVKKSSKTRKHKLAEDFCSCIKKVRKTIRLRPGQPKTPAAKEAAAIAVCVNSVLKTKGRTLKKFRCIPKKPMLQTQKPLRGGAILVGAGNPGEMYQTDENIFIEEANVPTNVKEITMNQLQPLSKNSEEEDFP